MAKSQWSPFDGLDGTFQGYHLWWKHHWRSNAMPPQIVQKSSAFLMMTVVPRFTLVLVVCEPCHWKGQKRNDFKGGDAWMKRWLNVKGLGVVDLFKKFGMQQTREKEMYTSNHWHLTFRMTLPVSENHHELSWLWTGISGKLCENGQTLEDLQALYKSFQDQPYGWISWMALSFLPKDDYLKNGHWSTFWYSLSQWPPFKLLRIQYSVGKKWSSNFYFMVRNGWVRAISLLVTLHVSHGIHILRLL